VELRWREMWTGRDFDELIQVAEVVEEDEAVEDEPIEDDEPIELDLDEPEE
jgi:hypothetical protein